MKVTITVGECKDACSRTINLEPAAVEALENFHGDPTRTITAFMRDEAPAVTCPHLVTEVLARALGDFVRTVVEQYPSKELQELQQQYEEAKRRSLEGLSFS